MSYELFRNELMRSLRDIVGDDRIQDVILAVDRVAGDYNISKKEVSLSVVNGIPDVMKTYLVCRATEGLQQNTLRTYYYTLRKFFLYVSRPVDQITANDIRCFLVDYQSRTGVTDRTMEQIRIYINNFFAWCVREDVLQKNPCEKVRAIRFYAKPREPLATIELEMIRLACEDAREKAVVDLLCTSGIRVSELCSLKLSDVDLQTKQIKIRHGKGDKFRISFINSEAVVSLREYLSQRTDSCPYVIVNKRGREKHGVTKRSVEELVKKIGLRVPGIDAEKVRPHNLRHTFATVMIENGAPIQHVQQLLGHAKLETTMIYVKQNQYDIRRTHERCVV